MANLDELMDFTQRTLGIDDATADRYARGLVKEFGAEVIRVPKSQGRWRDVEIRNAYDGKAKTVARLAQQYGLSERRIWSIISEG